MFSFVINVRKNKVKQFEIRDLKKKLLKKKKSCSVQHFFLYVSVESACDHDRFLKCCDWRDVYNFAVKSFFLFLICLFSFVLCFFTTCLKSFVWIFFSFVLI